MSFDSLLIHTADFLRYTEAGVDDYGIPVKTWAIIYPTHVCRLAPTGGREIKKDAEVVISDYSIFVDSTVIMTERDRINNIRLASDGSVVDSSTFEILLVKIASDSTSVHHYELALQKVA
jgi:hypothetical protein